ncbi:MAG: hypothetical protein EZS28_028238 [Streblomastix strix]|uniref:Cullin neddylation domain-containing protein n=1 Tax=Streblomastix strix TaxID=222440 RepID=A0A5J4V0W1_9EUKA|nr:MAG: hypothetical protein EZS28_028238 [Streblomastix strix]
MHLILVQYEPKKRRFRAVAPLSLSQKESNQLQENVDIERNTQLDAAIVRIMKAKRVIKHPQLMSEVMNQIHLFSPTSYEIKSRIENLISRDYLRRSERDIAIIEYVA